MPTTSLNIEQQRMRTSLSVQSSSSLASSLLTKRAAATRQGCNNSQTQSRRKNKFNYRVEKAKQLIIDYGNGKRAVGQDTSSCTLYPGECKQLLQQIEDDATVKNIFEDQIR